MNSILRMVATLLMSFSFATELGAQSAQAVQIQSEQPAPVVRGAGGDIPDSQIFVNFVTDPALYAIKVPEGWAMTGSSEDLRFADKFDGIRVELSNFSGPLTIEAVKKVLVPRIMKSWRAVEIKKIRRLARRGGQVFAVAFDSNSEPDPVTDKQIRLEDMAYLFAAKGKLAVVTLWAPYGADNVDQWNLISDSFRWR